MRRPTLPAYMRWRGPTTIQAYPVDRHGTQHPRTFHVTTTVADTIGHAAAYIASIVGPDPDAATGSTFTDDVRDHLDTPAIRAITPTYRQRCDHLALWVTTLGVHALGARHAITPAHLNAIIVEWSKTLAPATVRKRCVYLQSFYTHTNGTDGPNPVWGADVPRQSPPSDADPDALDYADVERALAAMPDWRITRKDGTHAERSIAKVVARVIAYTGFPPAVQNAIAPHHLALKYAGADYPFGWVRVMGREKGAGVGPRKLPLTPEANAAFVDWHRHDLYGAVPLNVGRSFVKAWARAGLPPEPMLFYRLRHTFLTRLYLLKNDPALVARMGLHAPGSPMVARYTKAAHAAVNAAAVTAFSQSLAADRDAVAKPPRVARTRGRR